jgi:uncharacterized membrane protein
MSQIKSFLGTSLLGGIVVILPVAIILFIIKWLFDLVTSIIQPLTNLVVAISQLQETLADLLVIATILSVCFVVGVFVRTRLGNWFHTILENRVLKIAPGYTLIKETIVQFLSNKTRASFSSVALVQLFGNETLASAFITDRHPDGSCTVFVPTGPNPTSGNIFHLKAEYVHPVNVRIEDAMRSIISCGAGSQKLINAYLENNRKAHDQIIQSM